MSFDIVALLTFYSLLHKLELLSIAIYTTVLEQWTSTASVSRAVKMPTCTMLVNGDKAL